MYFIYEIIYRVYTVKTIYLTIYLTVFVELGGACTRDIKTGKYLLIPLE